MTDQSSSPLSFRNNDVVHPFSNLKYTNNMNQNLALQILPQHMEDAIGTVLVNDLIKLSARIDTGLRSQIHAALPNTYHGGSFYHPTMKHWFQVMFPALSNAPFHAQLVCSHLEGDDIDLPLHVDRFISTRSTAQEQEKLRTQYGVQAFLRGLLTDLMVTFHKDKSPGSNLAEAFILAMRDQETVTGNGPEILDDLIAPPSPRAAAPAASTTPDPAPASAPAVATAINAEQRYHCPSCDWSFKAEALNFRNLNRHWFDEHARSSRSAADLKKKWDAGTLGPRTCEEEKEKKRREGREQTEAMRETRRSMKRGAQEWRQRMQTDPERWERAAQEQEGYSSYVSAAVSFRRKRVRDSKMKGEEDE